MRILLSCFLFFIFKPLLATSVNIISLREGTIAELRKYNISSSSCQEIEKNLVEIKVKYYSFDGKIKQDGLIIVHKAVAKNVENIFNELLKIKFPLGGVDPFKGGVLTKTLTGMEFIPDNDYNYTGSYSCRNIQTGSTPSIHSFGMAIDLNPLYNPFIQILPKEKVVGKIVPKDGVFHINREIERNGKQPRNGIITKQVVEIFAQNGFNIWGGYWDEPIDYQHFQISKSLAILLTSMQTQDGEKLFQLHTQFYNKHKTDLLERILKEFNAKNVEDLIKQHQINPSLFFQKIEKLS